jgi:hypothetical protein
VEECKPLTVGLPHDFGELNRLEVVDISKNLMQSLV